MREYTAMLLDDHYVVRQGLISLAGKIPGLTIIGSYERSREMLTALEVRRPSLIYLDFILHPNDVDGCALIKSIKMKYPEIKIIVLSGHARAGIARLAIASGADGFCQKGSSLDELISATRRVLLGRKYLSDHLKIDSVTQASGHGERFDRRHIDKLTNREREVVELFIMGMSISEIAKKLSRDRKTISGHKQSAYRKLGISSDSEMFHLRSFLV